MNQLIAKFRKSIVESLPRSFSTIVWLLKIMLPISLAVRVLDYYGIISYLSDFLHPLFQLIGLPGSLAFVPLYGAIAVMASLTMTLREATILSIMCLIAHNLLVECAVTKKTGSSFWGMIALRIGSAFIMAFALNKVLPLDDSPFKLSIQSEVYTNLGDVFSGWFYSSLQLSLVIILIVTSLMILQRLLLEFNLIDKLSKPLVPLMKVFGLPKNAPFLWIVGNVVGLAYGGAVMVEEIEKGRMTYQEANTVNYHLSISHSLLEDTLLFVALGINIWIIVISRVLFAIVVVWIRRLVLYLSKPSLSDV